MPILYVIIFIPQKSVKNLKKRADPTARASLALTIKKRPHLCGLF
jgi:hypothetical protein